jgi:hypothetical protein
VNGRGESNWQPISMLATIASLIDGGLSDGREHYAMLLKARPKIKRFGEYATDGLIDPPDAFDPHLDLLPATAAQAA